MSERLITVKFIAERYDCSRPTAAKYIRQMEPHMENPLTATEIAFREWEENRTVYPADKKRRERIIKRQTERVFVPRHR